MDIEDMRHKSTLHVAPGTPPLDAPAYECGIPLADVLSLRLIKRATDGLPGQAIDDAVSAQEQTTDILRLREGQQRQLRDVGMVAGTRKELVICLDGTRPHTDLLRQFSALYRPFVQ